MTDLIDARYCRTYIYCQCTLVLTIRSEYVKFDSKMSLSRRKIARVALDVPLEDDLYWVMRHKDECQDCLESIAELRSLADEQSSMLCIDAATLVEIGHSNKSSLEENNHLMSCMRCAKIGQYISNMPEESGVEIRPLSLIA